MEKYRRLSLVLLGVILLWSVVYAGSACAEIGLGGKIESSIIGTVDSEGELTTSWMEHLNLKFLLPDYGDTSANLEIDLYYQPQGPLGAPVFMGDVSKLYVKQRFENFQLKVGRQPISWSFGSLINPVDYAVSANTLNLAQSQEPSENAILAYVPINWNSNVTLVAAYPEGASGVKLAGRARTNLYGFDLTMNYLRKPVVELGIVKFPVQHRVAFTGKGDVGPVAVYGAAGYQFVDEVTDGKPVYLIGLDYSYPLGYGSKILAQVEYLRDEIGAIQMIPIYGEDPVYGEDLLLGMLGYEIDEFSGVSLMIVVNPEDKSLLLAPGYKNQIGSNLDLTIQGGLFIGEEGTQFGPGPQELVPGSEIPRGMIQVGVSYPF